MIRRRPKYNPNQPSLFDNIPEPVSFVERVGKQTAPETFVELVSPFTDPVPEVVHGPPSGEKAKARDIIAAIRTLQQVEQRGTPATAAEREVLARFCGFGPVALSIFPNPVTGEFKDASWQVYGEELKSLLTPAEYDSAKRTTFNAFYTSPTVIDAMHDALGRLGVPDNAQVLEPGCGVGGFIRPGKRFIGVEMDSISGRIAKALHLGQDIRIEDFQKTRLPALDAVIGNVPFANIKLQHNGQRFALHDYFFAKSVDALKPGGVLALVTSHFTLDKQNAAIREYLADRADFLGAIRLPSDAFKKEGTAVVTDIAFLRKRGEGEVCKHSDPEWIQTGSVCIEGRDLPINRYFQNHPEMVLGTYSGKDSLYGEGYSVISNGDLAEQLKEAVERLPKSYLAPKGDLSLDSDEKSSKMAPNSIQTQFKPPPPEPYITEGSFFVHDGRIHQLVDGQSVPVNYGGKELWAKGGLVARRLAALIDLRDKARYVLRSQNEGWPESARDDARWRLNNAYDAFAFTYGPINKTTISHTKDGDAVRRMPNIVKFREDPDAMLVMALEEYDEETGMAKKAAIMSCDVVGKHEPITSVTSAEEGLLASLNSKGLVDLPYISLLYGKSEEEIISELGNLIYLNPETNGWETTDAYLSGNVRAKLTAAEKAGIERNIEALKAVQPDDVLPGEIDANLGAPWIPASDVQAFAAEIFQVPPSSITIGHSPKDAVWSAEGDYSAQRAVSVTADYGTSRANGIWLLELALNMKTPVIYDPNPDDPDKRVVNQEQTLAAKEKQKVIKERFRQWIFSDPDRTERLVRVYNDNYNNIRLRHFDGSHLQFPGMNNVFTLRQHQKDAIWRIMCGGNTLLAHVVGSGKTSIMCAAAMKMRQAGLVKKPIIVTPNHMLEQFGREFLQLYPNAKLLVAGKEDFTRERRKHLTAKIASGDWDAIIVTHSSFERIGMSRDYQERFLRDQIAEYEQLICDNAAEKGNNRNIIKNLEKQKAAREAKLKDLLAEDKKDDGLVFDELGADYIFYDESVAVKNLETPTKMDRVAGIQTGGSERAFDMLMKAHYLHEKHPGHGVTFANGTPIANSLVEMYTLQRFLDPDGLRSRGIEHFDAWAATFGEVVEAMEISPDGKTLKPRSRFSKFINLPELQQMFRSFADVQTLDMLKLPRPELEGGKAQVISCPMSEEQEKLQQELVKRYERIRNGGVDPREDNALAITTDGRKLALDAQLLSSTAMPHPDSKLDAMLDNTFETWQQTAEKRGTQMIFSDMGVNSTLWGFCVYDEIIEGLTRRGIPREQIAVMGDADSDAKKQALFEKVRQGIVRVLIGSTSKMGMGTNVQRRLVAMHHLDAPWKPAEVEQRDGRILRQGNLNPMVAIYRYVTEGSFDAYMWQALETKARFINQIMTGQSGVRRAEDVSGQELSYAEVKAIASGNPAVLTLAEADAELQRLAVLRRNHADEQYIARRKIQELPHTITQLEKRLSGLTADAATIRQDQDFTVGDREATESLLGHALSRIPDRVDYTRRFPIGKYRGLTFGIERHPGGAADVYLEGQAYRTGILSRESQGPRAVMNALNRLAISYDDRIADTRKDLALVQNQLTDYRARIGRAFQHTSYLEDLTELRNRLNTALSATPAEGEPSSAECAERIKALRAAHVIEAAPIRTEKPAAEAPKVEEPPAPPEDPPADDSPSIPFQNRIARGQQRMLF